MPETQKSILRLDLATGLESCFETKNKKYQFPTLASVSNQQRGDIGEAQNYQKEQRSLRANTCVVANQSRVGIDFIKRHRSGFELLANS